MIPGIYVQVSEPTKEELLARIAELEKQAGAKKNGRLEFRAAERPTIKASTSLFLESYRKKAPLYAGLPGTATRDMTSGMTGNLPEEVAAGEISS